MRAAAIDLGTNSMRLLVLDAGRGELYRHAEVTGLGAGVDATRRFRDDRLAATLDVVRDYAATIDRFGADRIAAVATSAARDATNGLDLIDGAESLLGVRPRIISGAEEAALSFAGATRAVDGQSPVVVIDVGGGSTEFVFGHQSPEYSTSIDVGSVRISERHLSVRPASHDAIEAARADADRLLSGVRLPPGRMRSIGVAGTFTSLAAIATGEPRYHSDIVNGWSLTVEQIQALIERLAGLTIAQTAQIGALDPKRAPVILGGAIVVERALSTAGVDRATVSEHDLLDGLAMTLTD